MLHDFPNAPIVPKALKKPPQALSQGYTDLITDRQKVRIGRHKAYVDQVILPKGCYELERHIGDVCCLRFPDGSGAYYHPTRTERLKVLMNKGVTVLGNDMLGLDISPQTDMAILPGIAEQFQKKAGFTIAESGALQDEAPGKKVQHATPEEIEALWQHNPGQIVALLIQTWISQESDKQHENVILDPVAHRLQSIDDRMPMPSNFNQIFPEQLTPYLKGNNPLDEIFKQKLDHFLGLNRSMLTPFYDRDCINAMFERARFFLETPWIRPIAELGADLRKLRLASYQKMMANT